MPEEYFAINHSMSRRTPSTMDSAGILAEVVALDGAKGTIALGTGTWRIDLATVTPANVRLAPEQGAMLTKYGSGTLTINGPFEAPLSQVFSGFAAGDVTFLGEIPAIHTSWFGAIGDGLSSSVATNDLAIASCLASAAAVPSATRKKIKIGGGTFCYSQPLTWSDSNLEVSGLGRDSTVLAFYPASGPVDALTMDCGSALDYKLRNSIHDLTIDCTCGGNSTYYSRIRYGLKIATQESFSCARVFVHGGASACFYIDGSIGVNLSDCMAKDSASGDGLLVGLGHYSLPGGGSVDLESSAVLLSNFIALANHRDGLHVANGSVTMLGGVLESNYAYGIRFGDVAGEPKGCVYLVGVHCEGNLTGAVRGGHSSDRLGSTYNFKHILSSHASRFIGRYVPEAPNYTLFDLDWTIHTSAGDALASYKYGWNTTLTCRVHLTSKPWEDDLCAPGMPSGANPPTALVTGPAASAASASRYTVFSGVAGGGLVPLLQEWIYPSGTIAINVNQCGRAMLDGVFGNLAISAPTGDPIVGQELEFDFTQYSDGGHTVTWDAIYHFPVNLPWTDTGNIARAKARVLFIWKGDRWECVDYRPWF